MEQGRESEREREREREREGEIDRMIDERDIITHRGDTSRVT